MPFVEVSMGAGAFTTQEKAELSKAVYEAVASFYRSLKGFTPHVWVVIREEPAETWIVDGEFLTEVRKKAQAKK